MVASPEDVLLTNGAQQALDVVARSVLDPGDVVVVEDPGYTAATRLFASHGATRAARPVDAEGLVVDDLPTHRADGLRDAVPPVPDRVR